MSNPLRDKGSSLPRALLSSSSTAEATQAAAGVQKERARASLAEKAPNVTVGESWGAGANNTQATQNKLKQVGFSLK